MADDLKQLADSIAAKRDAARTARPDAATLQALQYEVALQRAILARRWLAPVQHAAEHAEAAIAQLKAAVTPDVREKLAPVARDELDKPEDRR